MSTCFAEESSNAARGAVAFERLIEEAYSYGYTLNGDLGLEPDKFAAHLTAVVEKHVGADCRSAAAIDFLTKLHTKDFYLAVACAQHSESAWHLFLTSYRKYITDLAYLVSPNSYIARELADNILIDMFLPDRFGRSRIASYAGRSSLASWLRVIISHKAVNEGVRKYNQMERIECASRVIDSVSIQRIEAALRAGRYEKVIRNSFKLACQNLTENERLMLLLRYESELHLRQMARLLGVHTSTVARRLEQIQKKLRTKVLSIFACEYSLSQAAIQECLDDINENPSHSILGFIKQN